MPVQQFIQSVEPIEPECPQLTHVRAAGHGHRDPEASAPPAQPTLDGLKFELDGFAVEVGADPPDREIGVHEGVPNDDGWQFEVGNEDEGLGHRHTIRPADDH